MNRRTLLSSLLSSPFLGITKPKSENIATKRPKFKIGQKVIFNEPYGDTNNGYLVITTQIIKGIIEEINQFIQK